MSFIVVIVVCLLVYTYVKSNRAARQRWLEKLSLPGRWIAASEAGQEVELILQGSLHEGNFSWEENGVVRRGSWRLQGHVLSLADGQKDPELDLHLFIPGRIGLQSSNGTQRIFEKTANNVVSLRGDQSARNLH